MGVPLAGVGGEELAHHRLLAQGRESDRCDELLAGRGDDHLHLCSGLDEKPQEGYTLVGGDTAAYAEHHVLSGKRGDGRGCHFRLSLMRVKQSLVFWAKSPFMIQE